MKRSKILIIEDDDLQYEIYEDALSEFELTRVLTGTDAVQAASTNPPNIVILDHILDKGQKGLDFLAALRQLLPYVPVLVVSGALEVHQQLRALQGPLRAHFCIPKPVDMHELKRTVEIALRECGEAEVVRQFEALERSRRVDALELFSRSTDRLTRQTQIEQLLRDSKEQPNISALARQFKVARRTIIRDLQELIRRGQLKSDIYPQMDERDDSTV
ncbi:MAG: response regulator transcription factor [Limisphaerales bacterium]